MRGKKTLKYLTDIDFLKNHIDEFKKDYNNLLFYLKKHTRTNSKPNEEDLIYNINTYSYYKGVKGQANLFILNDNIYNEHGFVNACDFSQVLATVYNDDIYYLYRKDKNNITILKNCKPYLLIKCKLNEFSLFYLFNFFDFDNSKINELIKCLTYLSNYDINFLSDFLKKLIDFA